VEPELSRLSAGEASQLLGSAGRVARRARDACHHVWILPAMFGLSLIVGIEVNRSVVLSAATTCLAGARVALGHGCGAVAPVGHLATVPVGGGTAPEWSLGTTEAFWLTILPVILLAFVTVRSRTKNRSLLGPAVLATTGSCSIVAAEVLMRLSADVAALANVAAVCLALGVVAVADRSRSMAAVALGVVAFSVVLAYTVPAVRLQWAGLYVPNTYVMQCVAGLTLLGCGVAVRLSSGVTPLGLRARPQRPAVVR
jgi:hypothetical protein